MNDIGKYAKSNCELIFVGCKADDRHDEVSKETVEQILSRYNMNTTIHFCQVSAKTGQGVIQCFKKLAMRVYHPIERDDLSTHNPTTQTNCCMYTVCCIQ